MSNHIPNDLLILSQIVVYADTDPGCEVISFTDSIRDIILHMLQILQL